MLPRDAIRLEIRVRDQNHFIFHERGCVYLAMSGRAFDKPDRNLLVQKKLYDFLGIAAVQ